MAQKWQRSCMMQKSISCDSSIVESTGIQEQASALWVQWVWRKRKKHICVNSRWGGVVCLTSPHDIRHNAIQSAIWIKCSHCNASLFPLVQLYSTYTEHRLCYFIHIIIRKQIILPANQRDRLTDWHLLFIFVKFMHTFLASSGFVHTFHA